MLVELAVSPVLLWICFSGLTNGNWGRAALSQLFSLQWCRKPLSSSWQSPSLVCPRHCLEFAGCCPSYGQRSLELRRLCWMPTDSSIWAPARSQRGRYGSSSSDLFFLSFPHPLSAVGNGVWTGRELRVVMLHAELKHKVVIWVSQSSCRTYCWASVLCLS